MFARAVEDDAATRLHLPTARRANEREVLTGHPASGEADIIVEVHDRPVATHAERVFEVDHDLFSLAW
jgi:hypothetical protein